MAKNTTTSGEQILHSLSDAIRESPNFQPMLSAHDETRDRPWSEVEALVRKECVGRSEEFLDIALTWAKYELNGAPSNWEEQCNAEKNIIEIVEWALENKEKYKNDIKRSVGMYKKGWIPDCSWILDDYFD